MSKDEETIAAKIRAAREAREATGPSPGDDSDPFATEFGFKRIVPTRSMRGQYVARMGAIFGKLQRKDLTADQRKRLTAERERVAEMVRRYAKTKRARGERFGEGSA